MLSRATFGPDHPYNLIQLCVVCHTKAHNGQIKRAQLWEIIARREGLTAEQVEDRVKRIRRGEGAGEV